MTIRSTRALYLLTAALLYMTAIVTFFSHDTGSAAVFAALGSVFVALAYNARLERDGNQPS